ncbi:hypothetical protein OG285_30880 [Streptomyces sp. NBC_01471]|uniref:hypothetical protein n=1 Tax=Streptomyces sp. NBC_01471 TaxID=2903879 RepID=UPI00324D15AD
MWVLAPAHRFKETVPDKPVIFTVHEFNAWPGMRQSGWFTYPGVLCLPAAGPAERRMSCRDNLGQATRLISAEVYHEPRISDELRVRGCGPVMTALAIGTSSAGADPVLALGACFDRALEPYTWWSTATCARACSVAR